MSQYFPYTCTMSGSSTKSPLMLIHALMPKSMTSRSSFRLRSDSILVSDCILIPSSSGVVEACKEVQDVTAEGDATILSTITDELASGSAAHAYGRERGALTSLGRSHPLGATSPTGDSRLRRESKLACIKHPRRRSYCTTLCVYV